ncbi:leucine-rich repeat domain-containing protein [Litoribacter populi]|uniref:leucine-rich repeat domain-containing protein n=1 Tax=Litoribacter populi TaxID=2598460 RepID=UPI00118093B1|nr:leucine-rich repeat domain-containing protein [Litoribacter populi]
MIRNKVICLVIAFCGPFSAIIAQDLGTYTKQEVKEFSSKAEDQVKFLEYFLNTVGNRETSARDKDVMVRESFVKIFRDGKVQVEDDLLLDRKVITNKDVTAYLKDVDFFFRHANFKFNIKEVKPFLRDNDELSFLVTLDRILSAEGIEGEKIENTKPRFIEINLDPKSNDLKIVSMYTTKLSRDKELAEWWESLSYEWRSYFEEEYGLSEGDSVEIEMITRMSAIDSIDLSGRERIFDLTPIYALRDLKYINLSNTNIEDLGPVSHVTYLKHLDISNTPTEDIQFIKYSEALEYLDISNTKIYDIEVLSVLRNLKTLKVANTPIRSFGVLNNFGNLEELDLTESGFNNMESINELKNLRKLNLKGNYLINYEYVAELSNLENIKLEDTNILDLTPLAELENLKIVNINSSEVSSLEPLNQKKSLQRIYADRTSISEKNADEFTRRNRNVLLIHNVENLQSWWSTLPEGWREVLQKNYPGLSDKPSVEDLSSLVGSDNLDLSNSEIVNLRPAIKFKKISELDFSNTKVHDLSPLAEVKTLEKLIANNSAVTNVEALENLSGLTIVELKGTPIKSIKSLNFLKNLDFVDVDKTEIPKWEVENLLQINPQTNIVFRSEELNSWWRNLEGVWKSVLKDQFGIGENPSSRELHKVTASTTVKINGERINNLEPLTIFINLKELEIRDVPLTDISALGRIEGLQKISITQAPVMSVAPLFNLYELEELNLSNTGVEDLRPLAKLTKLKDLNLSGTNIKRLNGLDNLYDLRSLDIANTNARTLKPIMGLRNLEELKCFNTRINRRQVEQFQRANPDTDVRYY